MRSEGRANKAPHLPWMPSFVGILTYDSVFKDRGERKPVLTVHCRLLVFYRSSRRVTAARAFRAAPLRLSSGREANLRDSLSVRQLLFSASSLFLPSSEPPGDRLRLPSRFGEAPSTSARRLRATSFLPFLRGPPGRSSFRGGAFYISANHPGNFFFHPSSLFCPALRVGSHLLVGGVGEDAPPTQGPSTDFFLFRDPRGNRLRLARHQKTKSPFAFAPLAAEPGNRREAEHTRLSRQLKIIFASGRFSRKPAE